MSKPNYSAVGKVPVTEGLKRKVFMGGVVGAILGICVSFIVNITLVEISISPFFSLYFGVLFVFVGLIIAWRVHGITPNPMTPEDGTVERKQRLMMFAALIIVSGLLCFILEKQWFVGLGPLSKVPLYTVLGTSVSFALTFALVDLVNFVLGMCQASIARPLVESNEQVTSVLAISFSMGCIFGTIFGVMDVEDEVSYQLGLALKREESYCYPIGAVLGFAGGVWNEYARARAEATLKTDWDEDI
jgi:hypothetical protein